MATLTQTADRAVASVEAGDFMVQEQVGRKLLTLSEHVPPLASAGHYFVAEGLRLQADLKSGSDRKLLLLGAMDEYEMSRELDPLSVRAIRGLARTYEVLGDPEEATKLFQFGYVAALQQLADSDRTDQTHRLELSHEILRVTRHYVHCLAELRNTDQIAFRGYRVTVDELHVLTRESSAFHRTRLPLFSAYKRWSHIEWFMGLTLLAKSYIAIGDNFRAAQELCFAFLERRSMLNTEQPLTPIDVANLTWWLGTAFQLGTEPVPGWFAALEQLARTLGEGNDVPVLVALDALGRVMAPMLPPGT